MTKDEHDAEYDARLDAIRERVAAAVTGEPFVLFSAYHLGDDALPIDNLDEVAYDGRCKFVSPAGIWRERAYESSIISNPTWLDIAKLANDMIVLTGDRHHLYLEEIGRLGFEGDVAILDFIMGS